MKFYSLRSFLIIGSLLAVFQTPLHGQAFTVTQGQHTNSTSLGESYTSTGIASTNPTSSGSYTHGNPAGNDPADASESVTSVVTAYFRNYDGFSAKSGVSGSALYGATSGGMPISALSNTAFTFTLSTPAQYVIGARLTFTNSGPVTLADQYVKLADSSGNNLVFGVIVPGTFQKSGYLNPGTYTISAQTGFTAASGGSANDSLDFGLEVFPVPELGSVWWFLSGAVLTGAAWTKRRQTTAVYNGSCKD